MLFRFPGSLVNRALRSRLLTAQQYRATIAAQRLPQTYIASNAFSNSSCQRRFDNDHDVSRNDRSDQKQKEPYSHQWNRKRMFKDFTRDVEQDTLMAIASNSPITRYNIEKEIAESEALDAEAAENDRYDYEASESKGSENEVSDDPEAEAEALEAARDESESHRGPPRGRSKITPKIIDEELKWLTDPKNMANRIGRILHSGDPALAAAVVRAGTKKGMRCDVAWNLLLQYCYDQNNPQAAFKFWNDMKKRGRRPTARAFTIMLNGLSSSPVSSSTVKTALAVYRSITAPNSGVKLDIIHTNAMLTVCHRHGKMDLLWEIAGDLPEEGPGAPDAVTYTIIMNAVQFAARRDIQKMSSNDIEKILERKAQAISEGKRIWADVIWRWKNQSLEIDNDLVSAMASLLLDGASDMDCYNIMELFKQTMGIPILQKRPVENSKSTLRRVTREDSASMKMEEAIREENMEDLPFVNEHNQPLDAEAQEAEEAEEVEEANEEAVEEIEEEEEEENFAELFKPVVPDTEGLSFLRPKSKELTLLLHACFTITQGMEAGQAYWKHMTMEETPYRIDPDTISFIQYFRLLRLSRSSKLSVKTMRDQMIPAGRATGTSFHVALSVCRRDRRNHSVLLHANELLSLMQRALILPDIRVLDGYLATIQVLSTNPSVLLNLRGLDKDEDSTSNKARKPLRLADQGRKLQAKLRLAALATLRPYVLTLEEAMENGKPASQTRWDTKRNASDSIQGSAAVKFMSRVRLVVDDTLKIDYKNYVSKTERKTLQVESNMLKKYSDRQVIEKWQKKLVYPTPMQRLESRERMQQYELENSESANKPEELFPREAEAEAEA
ncbi:Pentatricopeptide repeat protein [Penicillium paradoxum]|uniref:Pentatricopeptide repeat protein n=1 Tax=Penicillium paradoxum TaxID=176176 RepID=UPI0025499186|nr:Pentatricopeptide repeat protein [Penicillium paradoxum]KAJ5787528.1 Pentatricopeptide repeat protein [Penicillium paradoxum]